MLEVCCPEGDGTENVVIADKLRDSYMKLMIDGTDDLLESIDEQGLSSRSTI